MLSSRRDVIIMDAWMSRPPRGFGQQGAGRNLQGPAVIKAGEGQHAMDLSGKVAVVTGGKRIGRRVAQQLAARGMNLVLSYRGSKDEAEQTAADVNAAGRRATTVSGDVSKPADCVAIVDHALSS